MTIKFDTELTRFCSDSEFLDHLDKQHKESVQAYFPEINKAEQTSNEQVENAMQEYLSTVVKDAPKAPTTESSRWEWYSHLPSIQESATTLTGLYQKLPNLRGLINTATSAFIAAHADISGLASLTSLQESAQPSESKDTEDTEDREDTEKPSSSFNFLNNFVYYEEQVSAPGFTPEADSDDTPMPKRPSIDSHSSEQPPAGMPRKQVQKSEARNTNQNASFPSSKKTEQLKVASSVKIPWPTTVGRLFTTASTDAMPTKEEFVRACQHMGFEYDPGMLYDSDLEGQDKRDFETKETMQYRRYFNHMHRVAAHLSLDSKPLEEQIQAYEKAADNLQALFNQKSAKKEDGRHVKTWFKAVALDRMIDSSVEKVRTAINEKRAPIVMPSITAPMAQFALVDGERQHYVKPVKYDRSMESDLYGERAKFETSEDKMKSTLFTLLYTRATRAK